MIGGLESRLCTSVSEKLVSDSIIIPAENRNIVLSLNQAYFDQYGPVKPSPKVCQKMAEMVPCYLSCEESCLNIFRYF